MQLSLSMSTELHLNTKTCFSKAYKKASVHLNRIVWFWVRAGFARKGAFPTLPVSLSLLLPVGGRRWTPNTFVKRQPKSSLNWLQAGRTADRCIWAMPKTKVVLKYRAEARMCSFLAVESWYCDDRETSLKMMMKMMGGRQRPETNNVSRRPNSIWTIIIMRWSLKWMLEVSPSKADRRSVRIG